MTEPKGPADERRAFGLDHANCEQCYNLCHETRACSMECVDCCDSCGWPRLDDAYREVASALAVLRGHELSCGAYKQASGEHYSASAFGFFVALGLVRGEIEPALCGVSVPSTATVARPLRTVLLYTLAPSGSHALCGVCA